MASAWWLSKWEWDCGAQRPTGRHAPPLMALVFGFYRVRRTDSHMEQKLQMEISACSICSFLWWAVCTVAAGLPPLSAGVGRSQVGGLTVVGGSSSGQTDVRD